MVEAVDDPCGVELGLVRPMGFEGLSYAPPKKKIDSLVLDQDQTEQTFSLPEGSQILSVKESKGFIKVWYWSNLDSKWEQKFHFKVIATGERFGPSINDRFIGTVIMDTGLVWHIFVRKCS